MFVPSAGTVSENEESPAVMEKGRFSVEWLAQSSRGGDNRTAQGECGARGGTAAGGRRENDSSTCGAARVTAPPTPLSLPAAHAVRAAPRRRSPAHEAEAGGGARPRTKFSAVQLQELERSFREQRYIGASEKRRLAAALDLSQSQVSGRGGRGEGWVCGRLCPAAAQNCGESASSLRLARLYRFVLTHKYQISAFSLLKRCLDAEALRDPPQSRISPAAPELQVDQIAPLSEQRYQPHVS